MKFKTLAILGGLVLAAANASACYTVLDARNRVVYQGVDAPVDMSLPLHQALQQRYPGGHMVFDLATNCTPVGVAQVARSNASDVPPNTIRMERTGRSQPVSAPLLTDRRTANDLGLPHKVVSGDIVMVEAQHAARVNLPSMTVVPSTTVAAAPNTTAMGAAPAPATGARKPTVITEMHNPPLTIIERGPNVTVQRY